jgi:hypothetical protein
MAQSSGGGFNVTIRALDEVTSVADRIKRELKSLGEAPQQQVKATNSLFDKLGVGIKETGRGLAEIGHKARETGERLHKAFEPIAEITGLGGVAAIGSIGGITLALDKYAASGANLLRTSQAMGINVETLQAFQQGAKLAGADAGALTQGLDTLNQKLRGAAWGSDAGAVAVFKQLNIAIRDSNGQIRKAQDVLPEIAEAVKRNIADPYIAGDVAVKTLGDSARVLMPYLRDGAEGLDRFNREAKGFGAVLGPEAVRQAEAFERSQREVGLALDGVGHALSEKVLPVLTPMLKGFADWIATSPDVTKGIKGIADEVEKFGKWIKEIDWDKTKEGIAGLGQGFASLGKGLDTVLDSMKWMVAHPTITELVLGAAVGGRMLGPCGAILGGVGGIYVGERLRQGDGPPSPTPLGVGPIAPRTGPGSSSNFTVPNGPDKNVIRETVKAAGGNTSTQAAFLAMFNAEDPGLGPSTVRPGGTDASWAQWVGSRRRQLEGFGWTNGRDAAADRAASAKMLYSELTTNPQYKEMVQKMNALPPTEAAKLGGFVYEQGGGDASLFGGGGHTQANMDWFHSHQAQKFYDDIIGSGGATGAAKIPPISEGAPVTRLPSLSSNYVFGNHPKPGKHWFTDRNTGIRSLQENPVPPDPNSPWLQPGYVLPPLEGTAPSVSGTGAPAAGRRADGSFTDDNAGTRARHLAGGNQNAGAGDSSHNVQVTFANAPQGMRTGVQASGSANFTLRTQHALETW